MTGKSFWVVRNAPYILLQKQYKLIPYLFTVLIFCSLALGYQLDGWWKFLPSTILIVSLSAWFYKKDWLKILGFAHFRKWLFLGIGICSIFAFVAHWLITIALEPSGYFLQNEHFLDFVIVPFQTLNEELVFRGLILSALIRSDVGKWKVIILPAFIFMIFHWIFYAFNMKLENQGTLEISALLTIFLFGIATNAFFVATRSIIIPWALHCGWNLNRFGMQIKMINGEISQKIPEYLTFNLIEGSLFILILAAILTGVSLWFFVRSEKSKPFFIKVKPNEKSCS